jgi:colanic acid/amylovoran biosynthesis glycosyltransferase
VRERNITRYVLQDGAFAMCVDVLRMAVKQPGRLCKALALACKIGLRSDRPLPLHLIYLAEACRIVPWMSAHGACHLHAHFGTNSTEVAMLANILGGPAYSFTVHGPEEFDKPEFLWLSEKIRRSAFVVGVSSFGRSQLFRWAAAADWPKVQVFIVESNRNTMQCPCARSPMRRDWFVSDVCASKKGRCCSYVR